MKTLDQKDQTSSVNLGQLPPALAIADHAWQGKHRLTEERKSGAVHSHINLLNLETFNSVVALTNPNFESKYLAKFEAQLTEEFAQLEAHLRAKDWEPSGRLAHHCKGICDTIGAEALSKRLSYIERACHSAKPGPLQEITDQLPGMLKATCAQMKQLLRDLP